MHHIRFGNILLLQTTLMLERQGQECYLYLLCKDAMCIYCEKNLSVDAALLKSIFYWVLRLS